MPADSPRPFLVPLRTPAPATLPEIPEGANRVPTGVPDFDSLTGGFPAGSVVLLFGEAGSGHQEFALTSAVHLMLHYDDPSLHRFFLGSAKGPFVYPQGVAYISTSRSREQVISELHGAFEPTYSEVLSRHLNFHDLSPSYFQDTVVPSSWASLSSPLLSGAPVSAAPDDGGPLRALADAVDQDGRKNLVIVDSLTDLLVRRGLDATDLVTLLKGLRRRAKEWDGVVYLLLSKGVAPASVEQAVTDSVDGVLHFSWVASPSQSHRQRAMVIDKFMPILARIPVEYQGRFVIRVNAMSGLVTTQYERV
jgi:KaiC/GvpD/RAD55 family RecA-like ATPase